jgi:phosphohistidine swiveling domain-containing protein
MSRYSFDTDPHPIFGTYSAGNFGEVAPERLSIMAWSLIGDPVERGCRALVHRFWPRATWHTGSHYTFVGYYSCRPYHNLAAFCHMGREVAGVSAADVCAAYFEDATPPPLPPGLRITPVARAAAVRRQLRELVEIRTRSVLAEGRMARLEDRARAALHGGGAFALGGATCEARRLLDEVWDLHYAATAIVVPVHALQRRIGGRLVDYWDELEPWLNRPPELVWSGLHELAAYDLALGPAEFLRHAFYEVADDREPWAAWSTAAAAAPPPEPARAGTPDVAGVTWDIVRSGRLALLPQLTTLCGDAMARREATKALAMRCLHVFRALLPDVARANGVRDEDWPYLTIAELVDDGGGGGLAARAASRREECREALAQPTEDPFTPRAAPASPRRRAPRKGRGVSPGLARGTVVTLGQLGALGNGQASILVCDSADADVQPLLPRLAGVMTARGSMLSHVATLAREYGVPAVVGHQLARELVPGQHIQLDGTTGEVLILD